MATGYGKRVRRTMVDFVAGKAPTAPANWYQALSTANPGDDGASLAEPTSTGGYTRSADMTSGGWTAAPDPSNDAAAVSANSGTVSFPESTAAWSTGATNLTHFATFTSSTLSTEAVYVGRGSLNNPTAVNSSGVTLTFAAAALTYTCISA